MSTMFKMNITKKDVIAGICGTLVAIAVWIFVVKGGMA